jgi:hypothetical protein
MCRSIKRLRRGAERAADREIEEAALQFVRKISGFNRPTERHQEAFASAVRDVSAVSQRLLDDIALSLRGQSKVS